MSDCPYCHSQEASPYGLRPGIPHHPECPSQYRPRTAAHTLPLTNAAGDVEPPLPITDIPESE